MSILDDIRMKIAEISDGALNSNGGFDVNVQDQTTAPIVYLFGKINPPPTTIATATAVDDRDIVVTSAAAMSVGDRFGAFNGDDPLNNRAFFGKILAINANTVTVNTPVDFAFQPGDTAASFDTNMNVDGSTTPVVFSVEVGSGATQSIDITRLMIRMLTTDPVSLDKFGDLPSLTNGIVLRRVNGTVDNIWNVTNNGELAGLAFDYNVYEASNPQQGQNGLLVRYTFSGQDKHGVVVRLNPGDSLDLIIQDDLTDLVEFKIVAEGHYVD